MSAGRFLILIVSLLSAGCSTVYAPEPLSLPAAIAELQQKDAGEGSVSVGILTD